MRGIGVISFHCCLLSLNAWKAYIKEQREYNFLPHSLYFIFHSLSQLPTTGPTCQHDIFFTPSSPPPFSLLAMPCAPLPPLRPRGLPPNPSLSLASHPWRPLARAGVVPPQLHLPCPVMSVAPLSQSAPPSPVQQREGAGAVAVASVLPLVPRALPANASVTSASASTSC
jgi:hypothetical protein